MDRSPSSQPSLQSVTMESIRNNAAAFAALPFHPRPMLDTEGLASTQKPLNHFGPACQHTSLEQCLIDTECAKAPAQRPVKQTIDDLMLHAHYRSARHAFGSEYDMEESFSRMIQERKVKDTFFRRDGTGRRSIFKAGKFNKVLLVMLVLKMMN